MVWFNASLICFQVQVLVENDKNLDLRNALKLAAEVQPIRVDTDVINEVVFSFSISFFYKKRKSLLLVGVSDSHCDFLGASICYSETGTTSGMYVSHTN